MFLVLLVVKCLLKVGTTLELGEIQTPCRYNVQASNKAALDLGQIGAGQLGACFLTLALLISTLLLQ